MTAVANENLALKNDLRGAIERKVDRIAVNLSYAQLSENLTPAVSRLLRETGVEPSSLEDVAAIVEAIISMAHTLDLRVTAESVETATQFERLKTGRCDAYQSNLFCKPVDADLFINRYLKS